MYSITLFRSQFIASIALSANLQHRHSLGKIGRLTWFQWSINRNFLSDKIGWLTCESTKNTSKTLKSVHISSSDCAHLNLPLQNHCSVNIQVQSFAFYFCSFCFGIINHTNNFNVCESLFR